MRKLIFQEFLSLDGYAADKNHSTKFFENPEYAKESDPDLLKEMERFDTILLGAETYKTFIDYWPSATNDQEIMADKLNSIPKIVFSSTLTEAPWGKWEPAKVESRNVVDVVRELKKQKGGDMVLWGSISLSQDLIKAGLIDEYQFRIVPILLGEGTPLFSNIAEQSLKLVKSKKYKAGLLLTHYRPVKQKAAKTVD